MFFRLIFSLAEVQLQKVHQSVQLLVLDCCNVYLRTYGKNCYFRVIPPLCRKYTLFDTQHMHICYEIHSIIEAQGNRAKNCESVFFLE